MIDFLSTRPGASPQDIACARLLASVIVAAIRDAGEPLRAEERAQHRNMSPTARQALRFLFFPGTAFEAYARLIGSNAPAIRAALLNDAGDRGRRVRARFDLSEYA